MKTYFVTATCITVKLGFANMVTSLFGSLLTSQECGRIGEVPLYIQSKQYTRNTMFVVLLVDSC